MIDRLLPAPRVRMPDVRRVLREAHAVLLREGWTTDLERSVLSPTEHATDRRRTLSEAIEFVVPWDGWTPAAVFAFMRGYLDTDDLDAWNEAPGRTTADVLTALEAARP